MSVPAETDIGWWWRYVFAIGSGGDGALCSLASRGLCIGPLQDQALLVLLTASAGQESSARGVLEHFADTLVGPGRALEVLVGTDLLTDLLTLYRHVHVRTTVVTDGLLCVHEYRNI